MTRDSWTDTSGVTRWADITVAPTVVVQCWAFGHGWVPQVPTRHGGADDVELQCGCTRVRRDVLDAVTGERDGDYPQAQYSGGHGLMSRQHPTRAEARAEWVRRARRMAAEIQAAADAAAALDERVAVAEHRATTRKRPARKRAGNVTEISPNARRGWPTARVAAPEFVSAGGQ